MSRHWSLKLLQTIGWKRGGGGNKAYTSNMQLLLVWQQFVFNTDSISVPYYISTQPNLFLRETSFITLRDCWVIIFGFMNTIYSRSEVVNMCTEFFFSPSLFLIWLCLSVCLSVSVFLSIRSTIPHRQIFLLLVLSLCLSLYIGVVPFSSYSGCLPC